jgi:hypothetical protein
MRLMVLLFAPYWLAPYLQLLTTALHVLYYKKGINHEHIGWLCINSAMIVMQGLRPPEFAIIHAFEQSKIPIFDENTNMM